MAKGHILGQRKRPETFDLIGDIGIGSQGQPVVTLRHEGPKKVSAKPEFGLMLGQRLISDAIEARVIAQFFAALVAEGRTEAEAKQFIADALEEG